MRNIVIDTMSFFVTFKCNLRCEHCCTRASYEVNPKHFPLEDLSFSLSRLFSNVKFVRKFSFTGGEPLLRPDIQLLIPDVLKYKSQFEVFEIVTNGTIMPSEKVVDLLSESKEKVYVMIDRYGELSGQADRLYETLSSAGVECHIREYGTDNPYSGGWVDLGDFSRKHNAEETERLYKTCSIANKKKINTATKQEVDLADAFLIVYCTLCNGELHYCGRSAATVRTLNLKESAKDFVKITDKSIGDREIREQIITMFSDNVPISCAFCNGETDESPRVTPAGQMKGDK